MNILIVEDEKHLADGLRFNLELDGYEVETVTDGETALDLMFVQKKNFDVVVLDVMLPGADGFTVAKELRSAGNYVPILMLTARSRPEDVLQGFESGADDYLPKPFELEIFLARLNSLLRRREWLQREIETKEQSVDGEFVFDGRTIDFHNLEIRDEEQIIKLTLMEAKLLRHLITNAGQVVSRKSILEDVWELHEDTDTRAIDNFIVRLRRYLEDDATKPKYLLTVRGVGYKFSNAEARTK